MKPPHIFSLADLSVGQMRYVLEHARQIKMAARPTLGPRHSGFPPPVTFPSSSLAHKTITLLFSKRSTRTRLASETAVNMLGGRALFLGKEDGQMGVNESIRDSVQIMSGMTQGIFARVAADADIEEMMKYATVPVINALSDTWHPTQILADIMTLHEHTNSFLPAPEPPAADSPLNHLQLPPLRPLTIAYLGDSTNVLHDMLLAYPRLGHKIRVATPDNPAYQAPPKVWEAVDKLGCRSGIWWGSDPREAVHGADVVVTDTWISMGQEDQKAQRLNDFKGYQVTEALCKEGGANENWRFMHCLPRKPDEVDDEVFYGPRSLVFPEGENRKWTTMALFDLVFGKWRIPDISELEASRTGPIGSNVNYLHNKV